LPHAKNNTLRERGDAPHIQTWQRRVIAKCVGACCEMLFVVVGHTFYDNGDAKRVWLWRQRRRLAFGGCDVAWFGFNLKMV